MAILSILWWPGRSLRDKDRGQTFSGRRWCFCVSLLLLHEQILRFLNTRRAAEPSPYEEEEVLLSALLLVTAGCFRYCLSLPSALLSPAQWKLTSVFTTMLILLAFCWNALTKTSRFILGVSSYGNYHSYVLSVWSIVGPNCFYFFLRWMHCCPAHSYCTVPV